VKLKNRFVLLIVGVFVVPLLVSSLVVLFYSPNFLQFRFGKGGDKELSQRLESVSSLADLILLAEDVPEEFFLYIYDANGDLVFHKGSVVNHLSQGNRLRHHLVFSKNITMEDGHLYSLMAGNDISVLSMPITGILAIVSILLFLSILSSLTLRTINNSIKQLEKGTRRIADGDLQTPIVIKGDDTFVSLAHSFDDMRLKVKEEQDRQMRFFMGVSHDLKTPLSSITGYSEALLDGMATDERTQEKYLRIINTKGKLLEQRISHLIGYMKLSNNAFKEELQDRLLVPFLSSFVNLQMDEAALLNYEFQADISISEDTSVAYDPELLFRAMENLLQNCLRYGITTKPVQMFCTYAQDGIRLGFSNYHMQPLDEGLCEHMFEPFYRGDQARKGEGLGLGLASVKSIVESHGWKVKGYSLVEEGRTVFEILIPLQK
jgi:signal transduction histidine kinase